MQFGARDICILVLAIVAASVSGLSLWRISQSEDRHKRLLDALCRAPYQDTEASSPPRLPWYQRLGTLVAATKIISKAEQERLLVALVAAGIRGHGHLAALVAAKLFSSAAFVPLCWLLLEWRH